eukprot:CAMPEP_0171223124 /NCGR_PEP_ID=MMETSP0790-20130122/35618_1 /TAXON_ID=2925 /ORGANISM="Alexandrium catenella, Strain OF101" /LENGTH=52 /DNA_ID=CAMNT_0011689093 /DNA_START=162 /DNA_END=317 /DNA_ORIENTATION=-
MSRPALEALREARLPVERAEDHPGGRLPAGVVVVTVGSRRGRAAAFAPALAS